MDAALEAPLKRQTVIPGVAPPRSKQSERRTRSRDLHHVRLLSNHQPYKRQKAESPHEKLFSSSSALVSSYQAVVSIASWVLCMNEMKERER